MEDSADNNTNAGMQSPDVATILRSDAASPLEAVGGAVPLGSSLYIERPTDDCWHEAFRREDPVICVSGARQVGKTSLLARGLHRARAHGAQVVLTDFQKLGASSFLSRGRFLEVLAVTIAERFGMDLPDWRQDQEPELSDFASFFERTVLGGLSGRVIWAMDEADRLFAGDVAEEFFGWLKGIHPKNQRTSRAPWNRLTLAISYATESHLIVPDLDWFPFENVTEIRLQRFSLDEFAELNRRYGEPLARAEDVARLHRFLGGQPFLSRRALLEFAEGGASIGQFLESASGENGLFAEHLQRILYLIKKDSRLAAFLRAFWSGRAPNGWEASFQRLKAAGVLDGESLAEAAPVCELYDQYLRRRLMD